MDTFNLYLSFGKEKIMQSRDLIQMLFRIADSAMFSLEPSISTNNSEGAVFLQLLF